MRSLNEAFRSYCGLEIAESIQRYEATFADPAAYTTSWTIAAPMTRGSDPNAEIMEFADPDCVLIRR